MITNKLLVICTVLFIASSSVHAQKFSSTKDYSSEIEKQILSGATSTAELIVNYHPRIWIRGLWDWDTYNEEGSFAWRFVHDKAMYRDDPANDQMKHELFSVAHIGDDDIYGEYDYATLARMFNWTIIAAELAKRGDPIYHISDELYNGQYLPDRSSPVWPLVHTEDELLADARAKFFGHYDEANVYPNLCHAIFVLNAAVGYDWLIDRKYSDGTPVLTDADRQQVQKELIAIADNYRERAINYDRYFYNAADIGWFSYVVIGFALYEPDGEGISPEYNAKAKQYVDDFDEYWVGKILPFMNEQGGTGGWHGGLCNMSGEWWYWGSKEDVLTYRIAPVLFAHYTATGQSIEKSVYSTGAIKYAVEFQNYMIYPDGDYVTIGKNKGLRYRWIAPLFVSARRRYSSDPEQRWLGELAGWVRNEKAPAEFVNAGSYDLFDQLIFEEKWPNPRSPEQLGCGTRHFAKLGWVAMRSGFSSQDDLATLFICQRYHWSELDPYAQNSFHIMRKGWLIQGNNNTIYLDGQYQRQISDFPLVADGVEAYAPGSKYDVGPGIQAFESTDQYDYMLGDATNAYDSNKLEKFTRQLVYLKPDKFVILDHVVTTDAGVKKSWIVHPGATPQSIGDTLMLINNGSGKLWIKRLLPDKAIHNLSTGSIEVTPTQSSEQDWFLFVLQASDANLAQNSPEITADEARLISDTNKIGVQIDQWNVLFNSPDEPPGVSVSKTNTSINRSKSSANPPALFTLYQNYPNPFNPGTTISYDVLVRTSIKLAIYDTIGRTVVVLVKNEQSPGHKKVKWDGKDKNGIDVPSGIYFVTLSGNKFAATKKILLVR